MPDAEEFTTAVSVECVTPEELSVEFDEGKSGIILKTDGTSETWGDYKPDEAAAAFWATVAPQLGVRCGWYRRHQRQERL